MQAPTIMDRPRCTSAIFLGHCSFIMLLPIHKFVMAGQSQIWFSSFLSTVLMALYSARKLDCFQGFSIA